MTTPIKKTKEAIIKDFIVAGDRAGIDSFILGFEADGLITTHLQKMPMNILSRLVIGLFNQMCDHEASQGQMSDAYRATMLDLKKEFGVLVKAYNAKFDKIKSSGKTKTV